MTHEASKYLDREYQTPLFFKLFEKYKHSLVICEGNNSRLQTLTKNYAHKHNLSNITKSALKEV